MVSLRSRLALCVVFLILPAAIALAGTDIRLLDANGSPIKPDRLDSVSITRSCGDCHDVATNARSVHFNRKLRDSDPESASCLGCHLPLKDAFNSDGTLKKTTTAVDDETCLGCHADLGLRPGHPGRSHEGMACIDCHKDAGHKKSGAASCRGCHFGGKAATPSHPGLPALHLKRIACESCHISRTPSGKFPGYIVKKRMIVPVDETGAPIHHGVDIRLGCCGKTGCADCHSAGSRFFFGATITQGPDGKTVRMPNYKSMGLDYRELELGFAREGIIKRYGAWLFVVVLAMTVLHYLIFGPHKVRISDDDPDVQRFTLYERAVHWLAMLFFIFLSLSGIAFLLHRETPMSAMRALHGQVGCAFVIVLIALVVTWWRHAVFAQCDKDWIRKLGGYLWIKGDCPAGKFNAGQKAFFWLVVVVGGLVISATGIVLLVGRGFAASWVYTLHDIAAIALIAGVLGHVYLGTFANPGTIMAIITGRVKKSWAEKHHSEWAKKIEEK